MKDEIRILIADDHPIFRHGLRQIIERDPRLCVIAECDDGAAALKNLSLNLTLPPANDRAGEVKQG